MENFIFCAVIWNSLKDYRDPAASAGFFSKCDQIRRKLDLFTLTEEILNGKFHFLCSDTEHKYLPFRFRCIFRTLSNI